MLPIAIQRDVIHCRSKLGFEQHGFLILEHMKNVSNPFLEMVYGLYPEECRAVKTVPERHPVAWFNIIMIVNSNLVNFDIHPPTQKNLF